MDLLLELQQLIQKMLFGLIAENYF